ncbi:protein of unknown function DUF29 [Limnospira maxima CS-328]|uniref:DUF29 domain-containing protein n=1 Tax=Limnospira maxima CS-328 TaxID=513049 RepID=B5W969_LIMMA|nr:DUF29 domain-containing protein [Limnospira maxima]EDZ91941.1 protein of unknown function DUF29 [Limnospira maxima CS-328]
MQQLSESLKSLYDTDYNLWVLETVKHLKKGDFEAVDLENLIEEVLDLSKRDKRKLASLLTLLFEHLLMWQYWEAETERNRGHWEREITNFRLQIVRLLEDSPSLRNYLDDQLSQCYQDGCKLASRHSQLPLETFPEKAIANLDQVLDENWFPRVSK